MKQDNDELIKLITFYLPQFHPIPENDTWWGKGFTEWRNVAKVTPKFKNHYQPHLPADLGYYDLRVPEVREAQVELARNYGIYGFCYYHYWFNGKRLLERPFNEVLNSGKPNFPFCLCWANENWTKAWDGRTGQNLIEQNYSPEDDLSHIRCLIPAFKDRRYIKIGGKPVFLVYRTELLPNPVRTVELWRKEIKKVGLNGLYLIRVESFTKSPNPGQIGFDAAVEFAPDWHNMGPILKRGIINSLTTKFGITFNRFFNNRIFDYTEMVRLMTQKEHPPYKRYRCVTPSWDNSARRDNDATIFINSTPDKYENWLRAVINETKITFKNDERFVFINAWNEWAEGSHLEPDIKWSHAYLKATKNALS